MSVNAVIFFCFLMWKYRVHITKQRRWSNRLTLYEQFIAKHNLITDKRTKNFWLHFLLFGNIFHFGHRRCGLCVYFFFRSELWNSVFLNAFLLNAIFFTTVPFTFWHVFISNHNLIAILFEWLQHRIDDILFFSAIFSLKRSKRYQNRETWEKQMTFRFFLFISYIMIVEQCNSWVYGSKVSTMHYPALLSVVCENNKIEMKKTITESDGSTNQRPYDFTFSPVVERFCFFSIFESQMHFSLEYWTGNATTKTRAATAVATAANIHGVTTINGK